MTVTCTEAMQGSAINYVENQTKFPRDAQSITEPCRRSLGCFPGTNGGRGGFGSSGASRELGTGMARWCHPAAGEEEGEDAHTLKWALCQE